MTTVKGLGIVALLLSSMSLALAQSGPPSGGQPAVAGRPPAAPPASGPPGPGINPAPKYEQSVAAPTGTASGTRMATRHHKKNVHVGKSPAGSLADVLSNRSGKQSELRLRSGKNAVCEGNVVPRLLKYVLAIAQTGRRDRNYTQSLTL